MKNSKVKIRSNQNPVFLEVESGYSTLGAFSLILHSGNQQIELYPGRVKKTHDNIADIFLLPSVDELLNSKLYIFGKYGPSPTHNQIWVKYNFVQESMELDVIEKKSNEIEDVINGLSKRYYNSFTFEK